MSKPTANNRKRTMFPKPLGETIGKVTKPLMKKHGLPDGLLQAWSHIAGRDLASYCTPVACKRSKKSAAATLVIEVLPSYNLVAQHAVGVMVEKINLHYGYRAIERIELKPSTAKIKPFTSSPSLEQRERARAFEALSKQLKP